MTGWARVGQERKKTQIGQGRKEQMGQMNVHTQKESYTSA